MTLNYSHQHFFSAHLSDDNLISPFGIMNGYLVEGVDKSGETSTRCWHPNIEQDQEKNYACFTAESDSEDIVDLLPSDPFGMDIQTTVTAITGWLEDLEVNCDGYMMKSNGSTGNIGCSLFDRLDFFWNNGLSCQPFPNAVQFSEGSNSALAYSWDNFFPNEMYFPVTVPFDEKNISNLVDACSKGKGLETGLDICDTNFLQACGVFDTMGSGFGAGSSKIREAEQASFVEGAPHEAFTFVLSYLGVRDLLSLERVCKSLFDSIRNDHWLWLTIHIEQPLNERITDDGLLKLAGRAQGKLERLSLVECPKVTDDGLRHILETNPLLSKLSVPGCTRISIECVVDSIREFNSQKNVGGITHLRVGGLYGVDHEHFEELKMLLGVDDGENCPRPFKQYFYHRGNFYLPYEDDRPIDIEMCPRCLKYRLVYNCPSESCNLKDISQACRACTLCIPRCAQCGRCVNDTEFEETFCLELLCSDCFKQLLNNHDNLDDSSDDEPNYHHFNHHG